MEIINALLSNDMGYINALRHAPPIPPAFPLPNTAVDTSLPVKKGKLPIWVWVVTGLFVTGAILYKLKESKDNKTNNS